MAEPRPLLVARMVTIPLPPGFRVSSELWQFPVLRIHRDGIDFLGKKFSFDEMSEIAFVERGIRFTAKGTQYHYAVQSYSSKEGPNPKLSEQLCIVLKALQCNEAAAIEDSLRQYERMRRSDRNAMYVVAFLMILVGVLFALLV